MKCVGSARFSILVNGSPTGFFEAGNVVVLYVCIKRCACFTVSKKVWD